ncbi:MAG: hypothetical protein A3J45_13390 [Candidatus Rokubacteria bacterium RIFCSPHIGHO2_02_FULL_69_13]|nr:MAG: hypothetical protein A3J45_13390 [Candidatus Rokubacteria bacterium RIFCSPHIGHO2_02_FULL_69_13]
MLSSEEKLSRLRSLYDLSRESEEFEDGVSFQEDMEAVVVGDWAILAYDEMDDLALSFHVESHPIAVAKLTRFLVEHDVPFVLYEAFRVNDQDEIVFESDLPAQE